MTKHRKPRRGVSLKLHPDLFTTWAGYESAMPGQTQPVVFDGGWMLFIAMPEGFRCERYHLDPLAGVVREKPWKSNQQNDVC